MQPYIYKKFKVYNTKAMAVVFVFTTLSYSCKEVVEPDLTTTKIVITAPTNNLKTTRLSHTFLWEDVEDAIGYDFQIVKPSFKEVQELVVNEDLTENQFEFTFSPGEYQWRIRAFNASSSSSYQTYNLFIDSTLLLSGSKVILKEPFDGLATNDSNILFSWFPVSVADEYVFFLREPDFNGEDVFIPTVTTSPSYSFDQTIAEGEYEWSVKSLNQFSESDFATPRRITLDYTSPSKVTLTFPTDKSLLGDSTTIFRWSRPSDNGSPLIDSIKVYGNQLLSNLVSSAQISGTTYSDSLGKGTYYWFVKSSDAAGNHGPSSEVFSFTVN